MRLFSQTHPAGAWERTATLLLLTYFVIRALYFAFETPHSIPPDETEHFGLIRLHAEALLLPEESPDSAPLGLVTHTPYLYYALMGKLLAFNVFPIDDLLFLRLANVCLGFVTILFAIRTFRLLTKDGLARVLFVLMFTNTLMFTFLVGSVGYDNLVNLLAAATFYYLFSFFDEHNPAKLMGLALCLLAGMLTKTSFLPLSLLVLVALLFHERRTPWRTASLLWKWLRSGSVVRAISVAGFAVLLALNIQLYGTNLVRYGEIVPTCDQVLGLDRCMRNPVFARDRILELFSTGQLSYREAREASDELEDWQMTRDTIYLIDLHAEWLATGKRPINRGSYSVRWSHLMLERIYGIMGHISMLKTLPDLIPYLVLLCLAGVVFLLRWRRWRSDSNFGYCFFVTACYAAILMQYVNYPYYAESGSFLLGVQGRYLFPVMVPFYGLTARYLIEGFPKGVRIAVALATAWVFVAGDLPFFLRNRTEDWIGGPC